MPHLMIETNVILDSDARMDLATKASGMIAAAIGKPEQYVQSLVRGGQALVHGGAADPAAYVACKSIGLAEAQCKPLSKAICGFLQQELGIDPGRVYIEFVDLSRSWFGWNGSTF